VRTPGAARSAEFRQHLRVLQLAQGAMSDVPASRPPVSHTCDHPVAVDRRRCSWCNRAVTSTVRRRRAGLCVAAARTTDASGCELRANHKPPGCKRLEPETDSPAQLAERIFWACAFAQDHSSASRPVRQLLRYEWERPGRHRAGSC
jgi:hypothetical protein